MALFPDSVPADTDPVKLGASVTRALKTARNLIFGAYLNDDGTFKNNVVPGAALVDASVTKAKLASDVFPVLQIPTGTILPFAGTVVPPNFVLCDGTNYDGTSPTYSMLFSAIGTSYGNSGGASHFNVPDLRGRVPVGLDAGASRVTTILTLGSTDGEQKHTLVQAELPSIFSNANTSPASTQFWARNTGGGLTTDLSSTSGNIDGLVTLPNGSDTPHQNMQPSIGINYIIRL